MELKRLLKDRLFPVRIASAKGRNPFPPVLFQMATSYWLSQAIYVAAKLGIADLLRGGPQSCVTLAGATGSDVSALFRLLRALSSVGIFSRVGRDCFALSRLAENLITDVPGSLRDMLITIGEIHYQACGDLLYCVQTGCPAFNKVFGTSLFDYLQQNPGSAEPFNRGMSNLSSMLASAVLMAYDFSGICSIVDVGGGEGEFLRRVLALHPGMRGAVLDLPETIERATERFNSGASRKRCSYIAGDFFDSVPEGADAYLLCGVIHDWNDQHAIKILKNCHRAMTTKGRVLLLENVVPEADTMDFSKLLDVNMLVMTGGRERTKAEFSALLDRAGFRLARIIATIAPQSLIEAVPKISVNLHRPTDYNVPLSLWPSVRPGAPLTYCNVLA